MGTVNSITMNLTEPKSPSSDWDIKQHCINYRWEYYCKHLPNINLKLPNVEIYFLYLFIQCKSTEHNFIYIIRL